VLACVLLPGCTSWKPYGHPSETASLARLPAMLRVIRDDEPALVLAAPFVRADSLFGRRGGDTVGMVLSELRAVQRPRVHAARSLILLLSVAAAWISLGLLGGGLE
jgi:hypothetical protein